MTTVVTAKAVAKLTNFHYPMGTISPLGEVVPFIFLMEITYENI